MTAIPWSSFLPTAFSGHPAATVSEEIPQQVVPTSSQMDSIARALRSIQELYALSHPADIFRFFQQHPSLAPLVWETAHVLHRVFGPYVRLSLHLVRDPETGDEELFAFVHLEASVEEALRKLRMFDEEWFLDQQEEANGLFNVDVVFV